MHIEFAFNSRIVQENHSMATPSLDDELVFAVIYAKRETSEAFRLVVELQGPTVSTPGTALTNKQGNCQGKIHLGVACNRCRVSIRGFRYKCFQCPDFNLCGKCETAGVHPEHSMIRVAGALVVLFTYYS